MPASQLDPARRDAFAERVIGVLNSGALSLMISLGHRSGLFDVMSGQGFVTARGLAASAGLHERYVREWLGAMVAGGVVEYAPGAGYCLPAEHAACLTRAARPGNLAATAQWIPLLAGVEDEVLTCFERGGGVPYAAYERFHQVMAEDSDQTTVAALAGVAMPICECGSVPVARRLATKGLLPSAAVTFMLAAPVVNPVVIASTFVAYRGRESMWAMVGGRFLLGMLVAVVVGWTVGAVSKDGLLKPNPEDRHAHPVQLGRPESRVRRLFLHLGSDFLFMGRYLVLGATFAALVQTFLPAPWIERVAALPVLSIVAMMVLAALMSLCSESDAFIAASFVPFGPSAQLAFLVFGPMVDLKLATLYAGTFRRGFLRTVVISAFATTLVATMWLQVVIG